MNTIGKKFRVTTFGESHGKVIGCVVDGVPAGLIIDLEFIQNELDRRKGGKNIYSTQRKEEDRVEILSGVFEGYSTGMPIAMIIANNNTKSKDYENLKDIFRPSHADFTYFHKYNIRDYRGGGRSSARESVARVASGAIAKLFLKEFNIETKSGVYQIGNIKANKIDFDFAKRSEIFCLDNEIENIQKNEIKNARESHNSIGGVALICASKVPIGLGEPLYYKLDSAIAEAMMGLNGVKAVEIGGGIESSKRLGSENNDFISKSGFLSNNSGGILGGISNGDEITIKVHFKPTPSIFLTQKTIDKQNNEIDFNLKGRHDPCIAIRGSVVAENLLSIIIADMLLLNTTAKMDYLKNIYN
ncbi:chorismate synthase [Helicobacter sp. MIT 14-3879]|uniref:chorismate synthase n=1 Tax=Helicobacter sp. MIT 14-3879 TaxID=2040649 RepID=UPI000E1E2E14|nr:chorismate synthase [Helicobacter sp. MIT 14-3879]RDU65131.1 chorismate synthase [Helicobacter sp. MIT 14-3879]